MRVINRHILLLILLITAISSALACAPMPDSELSSSYNIFQLKLHYDDQYSNLKGYDSYFYEKVERTYKRNIGNIELWKQTLPTWSTKEIETALNYGIYKDSLNLPAIEYIGFARECENSSNLIKTYSWDYYDHINIPDIDFESLIAIGLDGYFNSEDRLIKTRYSLQVIKLLFYSNQYERAIEFFETYKLNNLEKNEIYYYILDYVAGCFNRTGNSKQAAVYFARIYCNSIDRRSGATGSFHFSSEGSIAQNEFVSTAQDSINFILLQSIVGIGNGIENARLVINKDPTHPYSKFITLRAIRKMDRHIWDDYIGIWSDNTLPKISQEQRNSIKKLMSSTYNASQVTKSEDRYFWLFTTSYLAFINRDFDYSKKLMAQIPSEIYTEDVSILTILCEVFSWNMINSEEEDYLFSIKYNDQLRKYKTGEPLIKLINHHVSHLYYIQGDLAKSFLVMNNLENLKKYKSLKLCQNLLEYINKENKTDFEQYLLDRSEKESFRFTEFENYISNQIVLYYLIRQDPESAQKWLNEDSYYFNIPNNIFSNQILDIVNPRYTVFSDSTHVKSPFLINQDLNLATLTETLVNLLSYTKSNKSKIRSEAYYLLGNFYYNICNTSHFRGLLLDTSYLSYLETPQSFWLYRKKTTSVEQIDNNKGYNISSSRYRFKRYWKYADTAFEYFQKAIDNSTDREFQTKCLYMMAKCEQNTMINNLRSYKYREYYKGQLDEKTIPYKKSFKKIRDDYSDTEYYDLLIEECSFFKHYCTQTKY